MHTAFVADEARGQMRYSHGASILCESLYRGRLISYLRSLIGRPRYQGDQDPMDVRRLASFIGLLPVEAFELTIDGQCLNAHWKLADSRSDAQGDGVHARVTLISEIRPVALTVHTVLGPSAFISRWLEIENRSDAPMALSHVAPLSGLLFLIEDLSQHGARPQFELTDLPDAPQGYEGLMERRALDPGVTSLRGANGRSGWGLPWFMIREGSGGEAFVGMLEWSANWRMDFTVRQAPGEDRAALCFSMYPDAPAPLRVIAPGEKVCSPVAHLGHMRPEEAVMATHAHIRAISRPMPGEGAPVGGARVVDGDADWLRMEAGLAARMGMEYFLVDAGWYGNYRAGWYDSTGDWNPTRLGATLDEAREIIHALNMKFGLWMEPESMGKASKLVAEHPGWSLRRDGERIAQGRVLDLARPEVEAFVRGAVLGAIEDHKPDFLKIDYNTPGIDAGGENPIGGYMENGQYRYVQALYRLLDDVAARHPDLILENCAAGGGRLDLGMVRRCHFSAMTDFSMLPRSIAAVNNLTMVIPPERLRFYYGHMPAYHFYGSLETQLRLLMFTNPLFVGFGRDEDWLLDEERDTFLRYIEWYKSFARPILADCRMHHPSGVLPLVSPDKMCQMECAAPDGSRGYAAVFRMVPGDGECEMRFSGVRPSLRYRVGRVEAGDEFEASGLSLSRDGVRVPLTGALSSALYWYRAQP